MLTAEGKMVTRGRDRSGRETWKESGAFISASLFYEYVGIEIYLPQQDWQDWHLAPSHAVVLG